MFKVGALVAAALSAALSLSAAPIPLQRPADNGRPPVSQQETEIAHQPESRENSTNHYPGGSLASRLYVEATCEHGCGYSENNEGWWKRLWTDPVATFTGVLAALTAGLIGVGIFQGSLIGRQIQLGRDEFNATHRPDIVVHSAMAATAVMRDNRTAIAASVTYFNRGTTPAKNVEICAVIVPMQFEAKLQDRIAMPLVRETPPKSIVPGSPYVFNVWSEVEHHRAERRTTGANLNPEATVYCIGTVSYDDGAGVRRQTGFSFVWQQERRWETDYLSSYNYSY